MLHFNPCRQFHIVVQGKLRRELRKAFGLDVYYKVIHLPGLALPRRSPSVIWWAVLRIQRDDAVQGCQLGIHIKYIYEYTFMDINEVMQSIQVIYNKCIWNIIVILIKWNYITYDQMSCVLALLTYMTLRTRKWKK